MKLCPTCKGAKKQTISVFTYGVKEKGNSSFDMECVTCQGQGNITEQIYQDFKRSQAMWCSCKVSSGSSFVDDSRAMKHHYVCDDCGKITQIG